MTYQSARQGPSGIGQPPDAGYCLGRPFDLGQLDPQWWDSGKRRDAIFSAGLGHISGEEIVERNRASSGIPCRKQLVLAIIEAQRKDCQHDVIRCKVEIVRHTDGTQPHIRVAQHHALGLAGGTACVKDCRQFVGIVARRGQLGTFSLCQPEYFAFIKGLAARR